MKRTIAKRRTITKPFRKLKKQTKKRIRKRGGDDKGDKQELSYKLVQLIQTTPLDKGKIVKFIQGNSHIKEYVNTPDFNKEIPLHEASKRVIPEVVEALVEKGADVNKVDNFNYSPLDHAILNTYVHNIEDLKHIITILVTDQNINNNKNAEGTPLVIAIKKMLTDIVTLLLDKGAEIDLKSNYLTPLEHTIHFGRRTHIAEILLARNAEVSWRALTFALYQENEEEFIVKLLNKTTDEEIKTAIIKVIDEPKYLEPLIKCLLKIKAPEKIKTMYLTDKNHTILHALAANGSKENMDKFIRLTKGPK